MKKQIQNWEKNQIYLNLFNLVFKLVEEKKCTNCINKKEDKLIIFLQFMIIYCGVLVMIYLTYYIFKLMLGGG